MNKLEKELREKLGDLQTELDAIGKAKSDEKRSFTDEEKSRIDEIMNEQDGYVGRIEDIKRDEKINKRSNEFSNNEPERELRLDSEEDKKSYHADAQPWNFGRLCRDLVNAARSEGQWPEEVRNHQKRAKKEYEEFRAITGLGEKVPADGGFLLTTDYSSELLKNAYNTGVLASKCRKMPISTQAGQLIIPGIDETSRADGSRRGGVQMYWAGEGDEKTASKPKFRQIQLQPKKLVGLIYLTDELMQDVAALDTYARELFAEEMGFKLDDAIIEGTGTGQPLGIKNSGALISVAKETGQAAITIVAENIEKMYARAMRVTNCEFYMNQDCWPQIFQLHHAVGTGGVPMFIPAGGLTQAPQGTLLGRPINTIEQAETLGTAGDIYLLDLSHYILTDKGGMQAALSIHVRFIYDETVLRFVYRVDGQPDVNSALTPFKGTNTISPFVRVAVRS